MADLSTVERKILFFRAHCGSNSAGKPLPFDPEPALQSIHGMPFNDSRYMQHADGRLTVLWVDKVKSRQRTRLATIRRTGLPAVEQAGELTPLNIPADSGIAEQVHAVYFPDNIVGVEFNFYGPRPSRLASYLVAKAHQQIPELSFEALLRHDVASRLNRLKDIRLFDLRIRPSFADIVAQADKDLGSCFKAAAKAGGAEQLEVVLRPARRGKLLAELLGAAKRLLRSRDLHTEVSRFVVKGLDKESDHVEELDLLSDELLARKSIVLQDERFRSVNANSAYTAIEEAYNELKDELEKAAGITDG